MIKLHKQIILMQQSVIKMDYEIVTENDIPFSSKIYPKLILVINDRIQEYQVNLYYEISNIKWMETSRIIHIGHDMKYHVYFTDSIKIPQICIRNH